MLITIVNWEKYNPRKDVKASSWLRLENNFCASPHLFKYDNDQKMVWVYLLCEASKRQKGDVVVDFHLVGAVLKITPDKAADTVQAFETDGLITLRPRNAHVTRTSRPRTCTPRVTIPTDGRTDGRDVRTNATVVDADDLASAQAWLEYAIAEMPWKAGTDAFTVERFADSLAKLRRATDLNASGIAAVLAFVKADDFWRKNAVSPAGLLKKSGKNELRKIDNILARMKSTPSQQKRDAYAEFQNTDAPARIF